MVAVHFHKSIQTAMFPLAFKIFAYRYISECCTKGAVAYFALLFPWRVTVALYALECLLMLYYNFCEVFIASLWVSYFGSIPSYTRGWQQGVRLLNGTALRSCWASNHSAARLQLSGSLTSSRLLFHLFGRPATSSYLLVHTLDRQL